MALAAGTLAYLLAVAVLDHWVVAGGLGFGRRFLLWLLLLGVRRRLLRRPGFAPLAAPHQSDLRRADHRAEPATLKNSLINFLLLRDHRREVAPVVYRAWSTAPPPI